MNKEVGYELRGFEESARHLAAVYTKCLKTVYNGSNLFRFKNYILFQEHVPSHGHGDGAGGSGGGRWCVADGEKAMMRGVVALRTVRPCSDPCEAAVRWELRAPRADQGRDGWLPCPSLVATPVTFRYVHHWRSAFLARHSAPLHVQGMAPALAAYNGFYKPVAFANGGGGGNGGNGDGADGGVRRHQHRTATSGGRLRCADPNFRRWAVYEKTSASALAALATAAATASHGRGAVSPTAVEEAATATATAAAAEAAEAAEAAAGTAPRGDGGGGGARAYLFRLRGTARWAFADSLCDAEAEANIVVSSTGPLLHPADPGAEWRLRENGDLPFRLVAAAVTTVPASTLAHLLDVGNLAAHRPIKITFRHADGDLETFYGTDGAAEELTGVRYVSATPRFIFRNSFNKFMVANEKADVEADRGIYRSCERCGTVPIEMHRWEVWSGTAWQHVSDVFCDVDLSAQNILREAQRDGGGGAAARTTLPSRSPSSSLVMAGGAGGGGDGDIGCDKRVEVYELGPVDIYLTVVPSEHTLSMSLAGYVSDLFLELARLHRIPYFVRPVLRCDGREYPPATPLHLLPRRRMAQVDFDPLPQLTSLQSLRHAANVLTLEEAAPLLERKARAAVGLSGTLLRGAIRLPLHETAQQYLQRRRRPRQHPQHQPLQARGPSQEVDIVELSVRNAVAAHTNAARGLGGGADSAGGEASADDDDDDATAAAYDDDHDRDHDHDHADDPAVLSTADAETLARGVLTRLDVLAELLHPNVQALVCVVTEPVAGCADFPRRVCFEHCGDGEPRGALGAAVARAAGAAARGGGAAGGATLMDRIRHMREYGPPPGHFAFVRCFAADCLAGLAYLHRAGIVHGSVLPRNIRFAGGRAVLCDVQNVVGGLIGFAPSATDFNDTYYVAPETAVFGSALPASDVFSLACCFLHFALVHELEVVAQAADVRQAQRCVPELRHLFQQCRVTDHAKRFTAAELLQLQTDSTAAGRSSGSGNGDDGEGGSARRGSEHDSALTQSSSGGNSGGGGGVSDEHEQQRVPQHPQPRGRTHAI